MPSTRQSLVLGFIVLLHLAFFYALQAGLMRQATRFIQEEVVAKLIVPEAPPPEPPPPPPPKLAEPPPPPPPPPRPTIRPIEEPPPPTAITLEKPPEEPPKAEPQPVVVAPAPPAPVPQVVAPAPPAPPSPEPLVRSLGDAGIEYVRAPSLSYPAISLRLRETGDLLVRVLVNETGRVEKVDIQKSSGYARLDNAAREAASKALFKPYLDGGRAVSVWVTVPFSFKLD